MCIVMISIHSQNCKENNTLIGLQDGIVQWKLNWIVEKKKKPKGFLLVSYVFHGINTGTFFWVS